MEFRGEKHRQIFQNYIRRQKHRPSAHHLAAVYLLTADKTLWKQVRGVFRDGKADLSAVHLCGIQPDAYALFRSAKELLTDEPMVGLSELAERDIIRPWVLNLIFQAILLSRGERSGVLVKANGNTVPTPILWNLQRFD